ncbi:class I SAM-dependent DNA methyltransferase [Streptomyces sp. G45]|uniref:class I SAM-dependent DNA methyltransferase n=1 Tax=Streptomyces sp. G45 TaxID=3406627 RepID=UPI003C2A40A8
MTDVTAATAATGKTHPQPPSDPYRNGTRASYDALAAEYHDYFREELKSWTLGRAILAAYAELVRGKGPVLDVGCGTGGATAQLHDLGVPIRGIDLSPGMVESARTHHPHLRFDVGDMTAPLDVPDASLGGVVAWYSTIHVRPADLPGVFAEFHRVLAPGGQLLLGFQVGDDVRHMTEALGHEVDLHFHRWQPARVTEQLREVGFTSLAHLVRDPYEGERTPHAHLLAAKPQGAA